MCVLQAPLCIPACWIREEGQRLTWLWAGWSQELPTCPWHQNPMVRNCVCSCVSVYFIFTVTCCLFISLFLLFHSSLSLFCSVVSVFLHFIWPSPDQCYLSTFLYHFYSFIAKNNKTPWKICVLYAAVACLASSLCLENYICSGIPHFYTAADLKYHRVHMNHDRLIY